MIKGMRNFSDWIWTVLVLGGISVLCFTPAIVWVVIYLFLSPNSFWQKFALFGVGIFYLGGLQVLGLIFGLIFWFSILSGR